MGKYFQTEIVVGAPSGQIEREKGIIRGVKVSQLGPAKGHGGDIDKYFLQQIVDNAATKPQGIKARFGHPNMCSTALGTYLGRFKNYSYNGEAVKADLYLDESAKIAPGGNLYEYVLNMAESNPDMFGASIAFEAGEFEEITVKVEGKEEKKRYFRLKELRATDIVDDPAATDGLFSVETLPGQATQLLDENPQLTDLIYNKPESVIEFLTNYLNSNQMKFSDEVIKNFKRIFKFQTDDYQPVDEKSVDHEAANAEPTEPKDEKPNEADEAEVESQEVEGGDKATEENGQEPSEAVADTTTFSGASVIDDFFARIDESGMIESDENFETTEQKLNGIMKAFETAIEKVVELESQLEVLQSKIDAKPSIPKNVTDPQVSTKTTPEADQAGKNMLESFPPEMRKRLKKKV